MKKNYSTAALFILILFTPLAYGTVEYWSNFIFQVFAALLFLFSLMQVKFSDIKVKKMLPFLPLMLFTVYIFMQIVPLPRSILLFLSPKALESYLFTGFSENISVSLSLNRHATYTELIKLIALIMVFVSTIIYAKSEKKITFIINLILIMGFITALYSIIQGYAFPGYVYGRKFSAPYGTFVNRDHFGGFMGMLVPLAMSQIFISREMSKKILFVFISAVIASASVLSLSRGAVISLLISIILFTLLLFIFARNKRNNLFFYVSFILLLSGLAFWLDWGPSIERFQGFVDLEGGVLDPRLDIWEDSIPLAKDFKLFGVGLGNYRYVFPAYQKRYIYKFWRHAHNEYLEMLIDTGLIGMIFLASFFIIFYLKAFIVLVRFKGGGKYHIIGLISSSAYFFMHIWVEFLYRVTAIPLYFAVICGTLYAITELKKRKVHLK